ncbi:MAG: peptidylprolyl isomerase [Gammaproteobacteria bacterium]
MHRFVKLLAGTVLLGLSAAAFAQLPPPPVPLTQAPEVKIVTTEGNIMVRLNPERAPLTVKNFLEYVKSGFYDGTIFHRVVPGFVIQGGGFTVNYKEKKTRPPIPNESGNGLENLRGTIAMARERAPHSATSQFYINLTNNTKLDPRPDRWGYAVFGKVVAGMDVVDKIASVPTGPAGPFRKDAPQVPVVIKKIALMKSAEEKMNSGNAQSQ